MLAQGTLHPLCNTACAAGYKTRAYKLAQVKRNLAGKRMPLSFSLSL